MKTNREIKLSKHASKRAFERGINLEEIKEVIISGNLSCEKHNRYSSVKVFKYKKEWEGTIYSKKQVKVIFIEENDKIMVITAISRFFN